MLMLLESPKQGATYETLRVLRDDRQAGSEAVEPDFRNIDAVNEDSASFGLNDPI